MSIPRIFNLTIGAANEAHPWTFPDRVRGYQFQARTNVDVIFAWRQGQIEAGTYMTIKSGNVYAHDEGEGAAITEPDTVVYFACGTVDTIIEIEVW
jgi:hypothetical protein